MALIGTREEWARLAADDPDGPGLKDDHAEWIRAALAEASPDAPLVVVDAAMMALRQTAERTAGEGPGLPLRRIAADIANDDEWWWLQRAEGLGLGSIRPVDPWPRPAWPV